MTESPNSGRHGKIINPEWCDLTDGVFFERRFLNKIGRGLTVFQEFIVIGVMLVTIVGASLTSFLLIQPNPLVSIMFVLLLTLISGIAGLILVKMVDYNNREMKKKQAQYVLDYFSARRKGHWVNGRRVSGQPKTERIELSVSSLYPRKGG